MLFPYHSYMPLLMNYFQISLHPILKIQAIKNKIKSLKANNTQLRPSFQVLEKQEPHDQTRYDV